LTCFRFDISPHIQLLRCGRQKKRSGGFATRPSVRLFTTRFACYVFAFFICKYKSSTGLALCQQYFEANEAIFPHIFKIFFTYMHT